MKKYVCLLNKEQVAVLRTLKSGRKSSYRIKQFLQVLKFMSKIKKGIGLSEIKEGLDFSYPTTWVYLRMLRSLGLVKAEVIKAEDGIFKLTSPRIFKFKTNKNLLEIVFFFILNDFCCPILTTIKRQQKLDKIVKKEIAQLSN